MASNVKFNNTRCLAHLALVKPWLLLALGLRRCAVAIKLVLLHFKRHPFMNF